MIIIAFHLRHGSKLLKVPWVIVESGSNEQALHTLKR